MEVPNLLLCLFPGYDQLLVAFDSGVNINLLLFPESCINGFC
jgi:hypothetical protein